MRKRVLAILAIIGVLVMMAIPFATPVMAAGIPTVASISPSHGHPGQTTVGVIITGTNFNSPAATSVTFSGTGVTTDNFVINSDTEITARVSILGNASLGARNVMVTNGSGTGTLTGGYSILTFTPVFPSPDGATGTGTSVTITPFKNGAPTIGPVYVGDQIIYQLSVSFPAFPSSTLFNFYGGTLAVSFPGSPTTWHPVAGYGSGTTPQYPDVPEISSTTLLNAFCPVAYTVSAGDVVGGVLTAHASYGNTSNPDHATGINGIFETGTDPGLPSASATSSIDLPLIQPNTDVGITAAADPIISGTSTTLQVTEANTGDTALHSVSVVVKKGASTLITLTAPPTSGDAGVIGTLDIGETWTWSGISTGNLTSATIFTATGDALDTQNNHVTFSDTYPLEQATVTVHVLAPDTQVTIGADPTTVPDTGGLVNLTVTESNIGNIDLENVSVVVNNGVSDIATLTAPPASGDSVDPGVLNQGETWTWFIDNVNVTTTTTFTATGDATYGSPAVHVTFPGHQLEQDQVTVSKLVRTPASSNAGLGLLIMALAGTMVYFGIRKTRKSQQKP